jgi:D-alanyl-D-alanine carboxypeptidase
MKYQVFVRICSISAIIVIMATELCGCGGAGSSPPTLPLSPPLISLAGTVDGIVHTQMQQFGIPGMVVALAKGDTSLYVQGYGVTNLETGSVTQTDTVYEIGSITKQFTAALIMKLKEQGKLAVDDPISKYLPQYNFPSAVTIRMCLTHTSGLANYTDFPQLGDWVRNGVSEATVLTAISQAPLLFQPGTQYSYSNSNFFILGSIIEALTGQSYETNLEQSIFQPLSLQNTYYPLPPAGQSAIGYTNNGAGLVPATVWDRSAAFSAGALSSNVYDLITWDQALTSGKVVSPQSFQEMTTSNGFVDSGGNSYGFGLVLYKFNNRPIEWHTGQIGGFYAENVVFLDDGFTVVVLTNDQDIDTDPFVLKIMNAVCNSVQLSGTC